MVNNEMELIMECNLNGHRDDGRGSCAECGAFLDVTTDTALSLRINTLENRVRVLEAALQSLGRKGK